MGYSKNYIMYWGVFTLIIISCLPFEVCTNFTYFCTYFCAYSTYFDIFCPINCGLKMLISGAVTLFEPPYEFENQPLTCKHDDADSRILRGSE